MKKRKKILELLNALKSDTESGYALCPEWDENAWTAMRDVVEETLDYIDKIGETVSDLRESGHAVALFTPQEIRDLPYTRYQIENIMVEAVNDVTKN